MPKYHIVTRRRCQVEALISQKKTSKNGSDVKLAHRSCLWQCWYISTYRIFCTVATLSLFRPKPTVQILKPVWWLMFQSRSYKSKNPNKKKVIHTTLCMTWLQRAFFVRAHLLSAIRFPQQHKKLTANLHTKKNKLPTHPLFRVPMGRSIFLRHHLESAHQTPGWPHSPRHVPTG